jgi:hypothetical protein
VAYTPMGYYGEMEAHIHHDRHGHARPDSTSLTRTAIQATLHCLTGCAVGEVLGMVIATALGLENALTLRPVLQAGIPLRRAARVAFASDTLSIATMEIVDNAFILLVPGAMAAGLGDSLFWWSLGVGLAVAFVATVPVNRYLIARGKGHAVVHELHRVDIQ